MRWKSKHFTNSQDYCPHSSSVKDRFFWNRSLTASPRGKRLGCTAIQQFDMLGIIAQFRIGLTANAMLCIAGSGLPAMH